MRWLGWHIRGESMYRVIGELRESTEASRGIFMVRVSCQLKEPYPGQFVMVQPPGFEEIPLSIAGYSAGELTLIVAAVGKTTRALCNMDAGEKLWVRGPLGRGFSYRLKKPAVAVAGGVGIAPLVYLVRERRREGFETKLIAGFKSRVGERLVQLLDELGDTIISTEDGSMGVKGDAVTAASRFISKSTAVFACGPEAMLRKIVELCTAIGATVECSLERYIKCGIGICGACLIEGRGVSMRVCADGPVFSGEVLSKLSDLDKLALDRSGCKVPLYGSSFSV